MADEFQQLRRETQLDNIEHDLRYLRQREQERELEQQPTPGIYNPFERGPWRSYSAPAPSPVTSYTKTLWSDAGWLIVFVVSGIILVAILLSKLGKRKAKA